MTFGSQITSYGYAWTAGTATTRVTAGQTDDGHWTRTTNAWGQVASYVSDYFSKVLSSSDFGAHATSFTYDKAARVTVQQNTTGGGEVDYTYTVAGQVATIVDTSHRDYASDPYSVSQSDTTAAAVVTMKSVYAYDNDGNRVRETYFKTGTTSTFTENAGISYDALNRVTEYKDGKSDIVYTYDANGNRRSVKSSYTIRGGTTSSTDWYKYDSMNRFVLTGGSLSAGVISGGVAITYDVDGQRHSATYASDGHQEVYQYSADGYVTGVTIATMSNGSLGAAVQRVTRTNDLLGRNTDYVENNADGSTLETRHMSYDGDGRVTDETDYTYGTENGTAVTYKSVIHNDYKLLNGSTYTGQDIGVITHSKSDQYKNGTSQPSTETTYSYAWWTSAKTATVTATGQTTGNSVYSYDGDGFLYELQDTGVNRKIFYQTDMAGQVVSRREWYVSAQTGNYTGGAGRDFFYLDEHAIGDVGTDSLSDRIDYAQQLANDKASSTTVTQAWTTFDYTTPAGNLAGNIDINYGAYNAATLDQSTSSFTALGGESLQDVAQNLWGDSSLWYILADANGLYADTTLSAGQTLRIPAKPANVHNNASTFKVYDPADTMGNTKPTQPQPPQRDSGCGFVGDVIAMVVSYVVRAVTWMLPPELSAGLADASRQGVEILVGNQKKFNWTEVKAAMTTAGIMDGLSLPQTPGDAAGAAQNAASDWAAVAQGAAASVIQQGVNMAYGLQKKFDWTAVAVAGAGAGAAKLAEDWGQDNIDGGIFNKDGTLTPVGRGLVGTAAFLAQTTTQMILTHDSFGKSAMAQLPEAIGSTVGGMIGDGIKGQMRATKDDGVLSKDDMMEAMLSGADKAQYQTADGQYAAGYGPLDNTLGGRLRGPLGAEVMTDGDYGSPVTQSDGETDADGNPVVVVVGQRPHHSFLGDLFSGHWTRLGSEHDFFPRFSSNKLGDNGTWNHVFYYQPQSPGEYQKVQQQQAQFKALVANIDPVQRNYDHSVVPWMQSHPRVMGGVQTVGGVFEVGSGGAAVIGGVATSEIGVGVPVAVGGGVLATHGVDDFQAGLRTVFTGRPTQTLTNQGLQAAGLNPQQAAYAEGGITLIAGGFAGSTSMLIPRAPTTIPGFSAASFDGEYGIDTYGNMPKVLGTSEAAESLPSQVQLNKASGAAFQGRVSNFGADTLDNFVEEVSIRPNTSTGTAPFKIRVDGLGTNPDTLAIDLLEAKGSATAPLTPNQTNGFPLVEQYGGTIVGTKGGVNYPAGTVIPPKTEVRIIRPDDLPKGY
ncbi:hypothetical protein [Asticcacaulis solisilvae]|uniref:hypothetical protein n=1 Tax=Asticcacaulis solisilvae TaxID=1217274 RepID=UPI003FD8E16A